MVPETSQKLSRISKLMAVLRRYLPASEYNHLALKIQTWEPETFWVKLTAEITSRIPKNPDDEKCVKIYSYLWNQDFDTTKAKMLHKTGAFS